MLDSLTLTATWTAVRDDGALRDFMNERTVSIDFSCFLLEFAAWIVALYFLVME